MSEASSPEPTVDEALDIQHDPFPAGEGDRSRRIPHLGHLLLLLGLTLVSGLVSAGIFLFLLRGRPALRESTVVQVGMEALIYLLTLFACFRIFPLLWKRSFLDGIEFNFLALRRHWPRLLLGGLLLCLAAQLPDHFIKQPEHPEIERLMSTPAGAWSALLLGVFLAPFCEEVVFRGFLLPALATAYDWLSLDRSPAGLEQWRRTTTHTKGAQVFAALLSSLAFAVLHAPQNRYAWGLVGVLFLVGLVLAVVRLRTHSLACSTFVHMTYNGTLFAVMLAVTHGFRHMERLRS